MWGELAYSFQHANGYVWAILILGFIAMVIFFERLIMLQFVYHIDFSKFLNNLKKMVISEDLDRAITLCKSASHTSLPHIALKALEAAETDPTTIKGTIEEEAIDFLPRIEKRLAAMPVFTLLIMLIGILGTLDSLWAAFQSVSVLDTPQKQATLAQGIASSLNPTAMGLIFGMILLAGFYLLRGMAVNMTERIHYGVAVLHNLLVPHEVSYMSVAASQDSGSSQPSEQTYEKPAGSDFGSAITAPATEAKGAQDESFDDVSVEDIKDEEEII